ncbi:MAG TPA: hypothetical protein VGH65_09505 [Verrucomicrobiaceae bacterium]|jgi:hypothetical protein
MATRIKTKAEPAVTKQRMEEYLGEAIHGAEHVFQTRWQKLEDCVRESPTAAVLIAAGLGHCLHRLPFRSLLAAQLRLAWALAPPALLALAATKAYQAVEQKFPQTATTGNGRGVKSEK